MRSWGGQNEPKSRMKAVGARGVGGEGREKSSSLREFALLTSRHPEHWRVRKRLGSGPGDPATVGRSGRGGRTAGSTVLFDNWLCKTHSILISFE